MVGQCKTVFIEEATREVIHTLIEAVALVFLVVFVYLQSCRLHHGLRGTGEPSRHGRAGETA